MRKNQQHNKLRRQKEAKERQAVRDGLSPKEQIDRLDTLLGKDKGAVKERKRLLVDLRGDAQE